MVEHVPGSEEQNKNDGKASPDVAVLNNGQDVWPRDKGASESTEDNRSDSDHAYPIDGTGEARFGHRIRELSGEPVVNHLPGRRAARRKVVSIAQGRLVWVRLL